MVVFPTVKANSEYADDLEAEEYQEMVRRAVIEFNQDSNDTYRWIPMKVLSVHSMFNIGIRFIIKVAMAPSNCTKTIHTENLPLFKPYEKCEPINTLDWKACTFEVFQFNWKVPEKVTLITCSNYNQPSQASSKNWYCVFKRVYSSMKEQIQRFKTYKQNMRLAGKLQFEERGSAIYGETQFSDLTSEEFRKRKK
ncbi:unnamed protein product [Thelazia callipaeda]|uniref:Inhibitor_I29 domain-containing protein n=1 Tax=Thelazia callipaeda TaxID=103827 RepID=A0A0N5CP53_THECL|nr:unnamed protein product [Thelazia callipaeda]